MLFEDVKSWGDHLKWTAEAKGIEAAKELALRCGDTWPPTPYKPKPRKVTMLPTTSAPEGYVGIVRGLISGSEKTGYVYFIQSAGCVKIGYAISPNERFRQLCGMMPDKSKLLGWVPGSLALEKKLQNLFAPIRVNRDKQEWFCKTGALSKVIKSVATFDLDSSVEAIFAAKVLGGKGK